MGFLGVAVEIALFLVGLALSICVLSSTLLPLLYGFPRALIWASRGFARVRGALLYLVAPAVWVVGLLILGAGLAAFAPAVLTRLLTSPGFTVGQWVGTAIFIGHVLCSKSTRRDATLDFLSFMKPHLTPAGMNYGTAVYARASRVPND